MIQRWRDARLCYVAKIARIPKDLLSEGSNFEKNGIVKIFVRESRWALFDDGRSDTYLGGWGIQTGARKVSSR